MALEAQVDWYNGKNGDERTTRRPCRGDHRRCQRHGPAALFHREAGVNHGSTGAATDVREVEASGGAPPPEEERSAKSPWPQWPSDIRLTALTIARIEAVTVLG